MRFSFSHYQRVQEESSPRMTSDEAGHDVIPFPSTQELGEALSRRGPDSSSTLSFQLCAPQDSRDSTRVPYLRPDSRKPPPPPRGPHSSMKQGPIRDNNTSSVPNDVVPAVSRRPMADEGCQLAAHSTPQNRGEIGGGSAPGLSGPGAAESVTAGTVEFVAATLQLRGSQVVQQPVRDAGGNVLLFSGENGMPLYRGGGPVYRVKRSLAALFQGRAEFLVIIPNSGRSFFFFSGQV